jgi:DNA-binding MarR family transcriptional regulator
MDSETLKQIDVCNCAALRQAARRVTQYYDQHLAVAGLRTSQYSILRRLSRNGAMTINALAAELSLDRTTLGRNVLPLQRDGLVAIASGRQDRRSKELSITISGKARLRAATHEWKKAQSGFEREFGAARAAALRAQLRAVVETGFSEAPA